MSGQLTTHALDLALGCGAAGLVVAIRRLAPDCRDFGEATLDAGGRGVLLTGEDFAAGRYELVFRLGDYRRAKASAGDAGFLDEVPVRFGVADASVHCHVPLLISPYGYSVYRGG
jgi:5-hydroxyisourate hydrolase